MASSSFCIHAVFPNYYDGTRVSYSLMSLLDTMADASVRTHAYVLGKADHVGAGVSALLPNPLYRYTSKLVRHPVEALVRRFGHRMRPGDVVYFWLSNPPDVTRALQRRGLLVVREMINCTRECRRTELGKAYALLGQPDGAGISEAEIATEREELIAADAVFCPNEFVLESVIAAGVDRSRCIRTSYGWTDSRIRGTSPPVAMASGVTVLFVGTGDVRKGFPWLLQAWAKAGIDGRLLIAGSIDPVLRSQYAQVLARPDVVELGYVDDVGAVYRSADIFVFPTWEEGGPMVTIEAMGAGLPCIVTPMGSAGIATAGSGGALIVEPGNVDSMVQAMRTLASNEALRRQMGEQAREVASRYTWQQVGQRRREAIEQLRQPLAVAREQVAVRS